MPFTTVCPNCDAHLTAPDTVRGKKVKCKKCDEPFVARPAAGDDEEDDRPARPEKAAAAKARPRPARDEDDDAPPRRSARSRRPADDDEDEEPRPRAKKKGKKKAQSSPLLLIVMIGVVLVAVAGAGVGVYFAFFNKVDVPDTQGDGATGVGALGGPAADGSTTGWVEKYDADGRYRLKFPSAPKPISVIQQTPAGEVTLTVYIATIPGATFNSTHEKVPLDRGGVTDEQILELLIAGKQQVAGTTASPTRTITHQSMPGREVILTDSEKKGATVIRIILAPGRLIALSASGDANLADSPRLKAFFESLKIE